MQRGPNQGIGNQQQNMGPLGQNQPPPNRGPGPNNQPGGQGGM